MTSDEIQKRIDEKIAQLKALEQSHSQMVQQHNEQVAQNQTTGCKIQGAIDELIAIREIQKPKE